MTNLLMDFPDQSYHNKNSLVIYFTKCNMVCNYCDFKKMLELKNLKGFDVKEIKKFIINNYNFIDEVIITGGEPSIDNYTLRKLVNLCYEYDLDCVLYSNLLDLPDGIIADVDKIIVDVKGGNPIEICETAGITLDEAEELYDLYYKYKSCNKFIWRIPNNIDIDINFKNIEKYDKESI